MKKYVVTATYPSRPAEDCTAIVMPCASRREAEDRVYALFRAFIQDFGYAHTYPSQFKNWGNGYCTAICKNILEPGKVEVSCIYQVHELNFPE